jgi:hypothetical protein
MLIMLKKVMRPLQTIYFYLMTKMKMVQDIWYLDLECSNHMSGNKELFSTMDESFKSKIKLGD